MRIVFAGTPAPAVPSLRALLASDHEVIAVVTRPDAPTGRGRKLQASPVADLARSLGIDVLTPVSARDPDLLARLRELAPDVAAVVAYGALLPRSILEVPRLGWINLHFSLLPAWRGAAPVQAAIRAGDDITGATTFQLEAGMDTGPVFGVVTEKILPTDTSGRLLERLAISGSTLLVATIDGLADGSVVGVPQPAEGVSLAGKVTVADAQVRWDLPAVVIERTIRAMTPSPGAWTPSPWDRLGLGPVEITDVDTLAPGELLVERRQVLVGTGTTAVRLAEVQPTGKRAMAAADWARGVRPEAGLVLEPPSSVLEPPSPVLEPPSLESIDG